jgi:hypothetical protein
VKCEYECTENDGISVAVDDGLNQTDEVLNMNAPTIGMSTEPVFSRLLIIMDHGKHNLLRYFCLYRAFAQRCQS